ncbi:MAG: UDP-glucose 4-epimerase [Saprospiraceae bacterium]|jgi:UDP-glucose 4-epimerase
MILVTGGAGYIGSHTVVELLKEGYKVLVVDNFVNSTEKVLGKIAKLSSKSFDFEKVDVVNQEALEKVFSKYSEISTVIHFAAHKSVGESVKDPLEYYRNNVGGLVSVLEVCKKFKVINFIFSSSCTVYGQPKEIKIDEDTKIAKAMSPYGNTKIIGEEIIQDFAKGNDIKSVLLRYFNPIGSHDSGLLGDEPKGIPNNLIPYLTKAVDGELKNLQVFGNDYNTKDGSCVRDYIHVVDIAIAHVKSIKYLETVENHVVDPINLGRGKGSTVLEVISAFENATGKKVPYQIAPRRAGDVEAIYANPSKAKVKLGWTAKLSLENMMTSAWKFQINNKT